MKFLLEHTANYLHGGYTVVVNQDSLFPICLREGCTFADNCLMPYPMYFHVDYTGEMSLVANNPTFMSAGFIEVLNRERLFPNAQYKDCTFVPQLQS